MSACEHELAIVKAARVKLGLISLSLPFPSFHLCARFAHPSLSPVASWYQYILLVSFSSLVQYVTEELGKQEQSHI